MSESTGDLLKQDGMARVDKNANAAWVLAADVAIAQLARERGSFTADDVWELIGLKAETHDPRALGPRMLSACKGGLIRKGGTVYSTRDKRHQAPIQVWVSCLRKTKEEIPRWTDDLVRMDTDARYDLLRTLGILDEEGGYCW
jgi:hypothetical protein